MPTVLREGPYRFFFFSNEYYEPPHIHIQQERKLAKFWLNPVTLASSSQFRSHELKKLEEFVFKNKEIFLEAWNENFNS